MNRVASGFAASFAAAFPAANPMPLVLWRTLLWLEGNGCVRHGDHGPIARLHPGTEAGSSLVTLRAPRVEETRAWTRSGQTEVTDRLVLFVDTGVDGSQAGIWRDERGYQRLVHVGAPNGPGLLCELADDPVHLLRLLALGYPELSAPAYFGMSAADAHAMGYGPASSYVSPVRFRAHVERDLDLDVPSTASVIVRRTASIHDAHSEDRFWCWLAGVRRDAG